MLGKYSSISQGGPGQLDAWFPFAGAASPQPTTGLRRCHNFSPRHRKSDLALVGSVVILVEIQGSRWSYRFPLILDQTTTSLSIHIGKKSFIWWLESKSSDNHNFSSIWKAISCKMITSEFHSFKIT